MLLNYLTRVLRFKETASAALYKETLEYLASEDCSEKSGNDVFFTNDWGAVVVCKPTE